MWLNLQVGKLKQILCSEWQTIKMERWAHDLNFVGSCLLWVMSTEISVDIAVDIAVDSRSTVGR